MEIEEIKPDLKKLDKLSQDAGQAEGTSGLMEPGKKAKRGRPSKEEAAKKAKDQKEKVLGTKPESVSHAQPQQSLGIPSKELARPVAMMISSGGVAIAKDPRASMTPDEIEAVATSLGMLIDKYAPDVMAKYGPEAVCIMVLGQYGLRVIAVKKQADLDRLQAVARAQAQKPPEPKAPENPKPAPIFEIKPDDDFAPKGLN